MPMDREAVASVVGTIVDHSVVTGAAEKFSGALIERVTTAEGESYIVKTLPREGDWLTRGTDGVGRARRLWDDGIFDRLPPVVDPAVCAMVSSEDGDVIVMRDVGDALVPSRGSIPIDTAQRLVEGLAAMHRAWEGFSASYCTVAARLSLFAPAIHLADDDPNPHPLRDLIVEGWEVFAHLVPNDIEDAVASVHERPEGLARRLQHAAPPTLLHGDAKPENLGTSRDGLVAIDWGELTGTGPAETDLAWFAMQGTWRIDALPGDLFRMYEEHAARSLEPETLDLACVGALAQMGFKLALRSSKAPDAAIRSRARVLLEWWVDRVRLALDRTSIA